MVSDERRRWFQFKINFLSYYPFIDPTMRYCTNNETITKTCFTDLPIATQCPPIFSLNAGVSTRAATQMTSLKQTPTTATPGSIANACQPRCINGNITHLLQPGQRWARVEIGQGQVLRLSVGDSIYETSQGGRNCALHISVVIPGMTDVLYA